MLLTVMRTKDSDSSGPVTQGKYTQLLKKEMNLAIQLMADLANKWIVKVAQWFALGSSVACARDPDKTYPFRNVPNQIW